MPALGSLIPDLAFLDTVVQDDTLVRTFEDALFPEQLYRMEVRPDRWAANVGDTQIFTRSGLMGVNTKPITPGVDPIPKNLSYEQWKAVAKRYQDSLDVDMMTSRTALSSLFDNQLKTLGLNAGQTVNRLTRNALFCNYAVGHTVAETAAGPATFFEVASIAGFMFHVNAAGQEFPVSGSNPKGFAINGVKQVANVINVAAIDPAFPFGRGLITVDAAVTVATGDAIVANDSATIIRSGGGLSVDAVSSTDLLTFRDLQMAIAKMRRNRVPKHPDGFYHCHLDPQAEAQLFQDKEFQNLNQSNYGDAPYQEFAIKRTLDTIFYSNSESPMEDNVGDLQVSRPASASDARLGSEIGAEVVNASGTKIIRTVISGGGAVCEKYIDEGELISVAGIQGKVGEFTAISNNGIAVMTDRIRMVIRAPQNRSQDIVSLLWSWSGDFAIPSDILGGLDSSRFKRAVVIESGQEA